jgi:FKBP-type peptidyl-prolyl cis-trans isomerase
MDHLGPHQDPELVEVDVAHRSGTNSSRSGALARLLTVSILLVAALAAALALSGCNKPEPAQPTAPTESTAPEQETTPAQEATSSETPGTTQDVTELKIEDTKVGTGAEAKAGDTVTVNYTGYLTDGTKFDSSLDSGQPFQFTIGAGEVIQGWEEGVTGMKVGGTRKLTIPPDMGYGEQGAGGVIPPGATLVFTIELLEVQ